MGLAFETEIYLNNDRLAYLLTLLVNNGIIIVNQNKYQAESFEYEFKEFIRMIEQNDVTKAAKMMEVSLTVSKIMNEARNQEGIVFDNDR